MGKKKDIIRVGDTVEIINPITVIGCGYERDLKAIKREIQSDPEERDRIVKALATLLNVKEGLLLDYQSEPFQVALDHVIHGVAYFRIEKKKGSKRVLKTEDFPFLEGQKWKVAYIYFRKTGEYSPAWSSGGGYYSEPEWEPAYLNKCKTHKILHLDCGYDIEHINVRKVRTNGTSES